MSTALVTGLELDAGENPQVGVTITARLYPAGIFCYNPAGAAIDTPPQVTCSADDGTWSLTLERTDTLAPSTMVYRISRLMAGVWQPDVYITVPAGGGALEDLLTGQPVGPEPGTGPVGPPGPIGPIGPPGGTGFTWDQYSPSTFWDIVHNLGRFPSVMVVDSGGNVVEGDIDYVSDDELTVSFAAPFGGVAYLN